MNFTIPLIRAAYWAVSVYVMFGFGASAAAQARDSPLAPLPDTPITLEAREIPKAEALEAAFRTANIPFQIEPGARGFMQRERATIHAEQAPLRIVVGQLLFYPYRTVRRTIYRKEEDTWVVDLPDVSLNLQNASPQQAFEALFKAADCDFVFWENAPSRLKVNLVEKNVPFTTAFEKLTAQLAGEEGYVAEWRSGVCMVHSRHPLPPDRQPNEPHEPLLTFRIINLDATDAIDVLSRSCGIGYTIRGAVTGRYSTQRIQTRFVSAIVHVFLVVGSHFVPGIRHYGHDWYMVIADPGPFAAE